ncbi:hypothetical protein LCGC14_2248790, partial [marine sediment metagenome]
MLHVVTALDTLPPPLAKVPAGAKVRHGSLYCFTRDNRQPARPAKIHADGVKTAPFKLEAPWYRSFDVTAALAKRSGTAVSFHVADFEGLVAAASFLEIRYEAPGAKARPVPEQATGLRAVHHDGQTFLVWTEHKAFRPPPESVVYVEKFSRKGNKVVRTPGAGWGGLPRVPAITLKTLRQLEGIELRDKASGFQGIKGARRTRKVPEIRYRIYRHTARITADNLARARWVGEAKPLSALDKKMAIISFKGEYIDQKEVGGSIIPTSCIEDGKPVAAGEAIYVHNPPSAGKSYYAVTTILDGTENARDISDANSLAAPVVEKLDPHKPVLQRLQGARSGGGAMERWYMFWAGPPYANLSNVPLHVLVGRPEKLKPPVPMVVDGFHGG